jgi:hypothetical protein
MASFSHPFTEDVDDWAGLSGLTLGSPMGPLLTVVPPTASPSGQGLLVVLPSSSSNASPALTTSLTSTSGEYNGFTFVSGLIAGGGGAKQSLWVYPTGMSGPTTLEALPKGEGPKWLQLPDGP